jgi:DNA-binding MarR family transcriptional regulator
MPSRPTPDAPPQLNLFLTYRLHLLNKLSDKISHEAYLREARLPLGEARCLAALGSFEPLSVNALAQHANLDKGQASRAAQSLVGQGLVEKTPSTRDARGVVLCLTRKGKLRWRKVMAIIARRNDEIFGCLPDAERSQLNQMFERLIAHVRQHAQSLDSDAAQAD